MPARPKREELDRLIARDEETVRLIGNTMHRQAAEMRDKALGRLKVYMDLQSTDLWRVHLAIRGK